VAIFPSSTKRTPRFSSTSGKRAANWSKKSWWVVAARPASSPALPRMKAPVHTDIVRSAAPPASRSQATARSEARCAGTTITFGDGAASRA
jgi:hypothetical protein